MADTSSQPIKINKYLVFFTKKLRLSNPWSYKVPFLMGIPYLLLFFSNYYEGNSVFAILCSLTIIIGVAGFGYLTNDLGDIQKDKLINKENIAGELSKSGIAFLFLLFLILAILPWFYLPMRKWSFVMLLAQFLLFYVYAFPPFRLKEKGFVGVITDSLYAHLNPALLAAYTFYLFTGSVYKDFWICVTIIGTWQFLLGIRNILFHQLKDYDSDLASGTETFVTGKGERETIQILKFLIIPVEILSFLCFVLWVNLKMHFFLPFILSYGVIITLRKRSGLKKMGFRELTYVYLDDLYIKWLPLVILSGLVIQSLDFIPILIIHFVVFRSEIKTVLFRPIKALN